MLEFYIVKDAFYELLCQHPNLTRSFHDVSQAQQEAILQQPDAAVLYESAISYFQEPVQWYHDQLMFCDEMQNRIHQIICKDGRILVLGDENPFLNLLKRKYPKHILLRQDS